MAEVVQEIEKWKAQIRKGFLELCVLAFLETRGEAYGLDLMDGLGKAGIEVGEGTLYPLLARMSREGSLEATWQTPERGHPRKYYRLSPGGIQALGAMRQEYESGYRAFQSIGQKGGL